MWIGRLFALGLMTIPLILVVGLIAQLKPTTVMRRVLVGLVLLFGLLIGVSLVGAAIEDAKYWTPAVICVAALLGGLGLKVWELVRSRSTDRCAGPSRAANRHGPTASG